MAAPLSLRMCRILKRSYFVRFSSTDDFRIPGSKKKYLGSLESSDKSAKPHMKTLLRFKDSVSKGKELSETSLQKKMENEDLKRAVKVAEENKESFASLFRKSKFAQLGNPKDQILIGKIFDYMNNDLYIDFGGKFYCVCRLNKPVANTQSFFSRTTEQILMKLGSNDEPMVPYINQYLAPPQPKLSQTVPPFDKLLQNHILQRQTYSNTIQAEK